MRRRRARKPRVNVNVTSHMRDAGSHPKDLIVLHETVSHDHAGLSDITAISKYLGRQGYGIHLIVDREGHSGYSNRETGLYFHCAGGNTNRRSIGIELVSFIPGITKTERYTVWRSRIRQLNSTARWIAYYSKQHGIPLTLSNGHSPGITTHWSVSQAFNVRGGHWDCYPKHLGRALPNTASNWPR